MAQDIHDIAIARLHRLQGQIRGIERLVDQNKPLPLILQQLEAASSATRSLIATLITDRMAEKEGTITLTPEEAAWVKKLLR